MGKINKKITIVVTGGGTGGHYYPAMSIIDGITSQFNKYFPNNTLKIYYIGSQYGLEKTLIQRTEISYSLLKIKGLARTLNAKSILNNILLPFKIISSMRKVNKIFNELNVDAVIGTGGYVTAIPGKIAIKKNIPLYLQEQNGYPGLTTRMLSKKAKIIFYAYEEIKKYLSDDTNLIKSGNPTQDSIKKIKKSDAIVPFHLSKNKFTIFIFGGSQGSRNINNIFLQNIETIIKKYKVQFIWQTGINNYSEIKEKLGDKLSIFLTPYIYNMSEAYSSADLIVARAGALTIAEIKKMQVPSLLIPLPSAAANHQLINAKSLEKIGAATILEEKNLNSDNLISAIGTLINDKKKIDNMKNVLENNELLDSMNIISKSILTDLKNNRE